jgi:coenzyme F420-reducing hydrogenase delta subunit
LKICVLYCSNSLKREDIAVYVSEVQDDELKTISLPCSGKIDIPYMIKAFETGADGVVIITCPKGECHNLEGNIRAQKRAQAVDSLLEEVGLGRDRIIAIQLKDDSNEKVKEEVNKFRAKIRNLSDQNIDDNISKQKKFITNMSRETT